MQRNAWNILIDAASLVVFVFMISTGLLLKFILPPGSGNVEMILREGRGHGRTIDLFMGLARHEWGQIHFYISLIFLVFLIVHLILHWNWIKAVTFGVSAKPQSMKRKVVTIGIVVFVVFVLAFPWIVSKQSYTKAEYLELKGLPSE